MRYSRESQALVSISRSNVLQAMPLSAEYGMAMWMARGGRMKDRTQVSPINGEATMSLAGQAVSRSGGLPFFAVLLLGLCCLFLSASAIADPDREHKVKVAFLYNFAKFIDWPVKQPGSTLQFCSVGNHSIGAAIDAISGKIIRGHVITVRKLTRNEDSVGCHLLYIGDENDAWVDGVIGSASRAGLVTIGDSQKFVEHGGIIGFTLKKRVDGLSEKRKIGFAVNIDAARNADLQISSELLKLATYVEGSP